MYAVTAAAEDAWRRLLAHVASEAGLPLDYVQYSAPQPLEKLWTRSDLGCVFMCGYALAIGVAEVRPIAAPIPCTDWARGRALYRSDLIVASDSPYRKFEDTFGGRAGWTVLHSHSGFNALRHHLLAYRTPERTKLYSEMRGNLVTARAVLDAVRERRIDIGPLDAYWHALLARHAPQLLDGVRVLASTELAPIPAFVASPSMPAASIEKLRTAFLTAPGQSWFAPLSEQLLIAGFAPVSATDYAVLLDWDRAAKASGYDLPG